MTDYEIDLLLFLSFRYALGRATYIVDDVADLLLKYKKHLNEHTVRQIKAEIDHAIGAGEAGHRVDVDSWNKVKRML